MRVTPLIGRVYERGGAVRSLVEAGTFLVDYVRGYRIEEVR
jgi:hypothetical protein